MNYLIFQTGPICLDINKKSLAAMRKFGPQNVSFKLLNFASENRLMRLNGLTAMTANSFKHFFL